ncbi:TPA: cell division protein ZipA C-terminal FtsZ-binding domain-containing protein [Legionella pneumophila]|uniref:Cell division protein ZipA n=1 Tax=Legionella pneumophila TaxID=446 RepID=A0A2S6EV70_LEGPN|nr:cell division protein ZipA C-terminal FtsZ-binding domain-containing protein [Legionella pneumophila]APF07320.1 cell division protein ZipA [Legionella pneumophila subsp. fraseri]AUB69777.1 cell division protein ZipA [Legionella pneumophila]AUB72752.1 cell division protein ZipA [Legionella pneumophila]KXB25749.1 cell division protein ZipA [Legionella pneumophila]KXB28193.1 cell division protein ZipA [Legionella pneumophila]
MQANWSLILNVLLLIGVLVAIGRLMKTRRQSLNQEHYQPSLGQAENSSYGSQSYNDEIIAVRKVNREAPLDFENFDGSEKRQSIRKPAVKTAQPQLIPEEEVLESNERTESNSDCSSSTVMVFLLAKENRQFAGYELLQTVLAAGLRFGERHLFHRHQLSNGQGPVLCSLAAATATGVFDLQNIGAFSVRGLCLFMQISNNPDIDAERFSIMLDTAKQLSEGLDAYLLDDQRKPLTEERIARYHRYLKIEHLMDDCATV